MYLGDSISDRRAARIAAREQRRGTRDQDRAERMATAFARRMREPVSTTEELEVPTAAMPLIPQMPTPAMPQTPYGMPVESEEGGAEMETPAVTAAPASGGGILPLLIGGAALLLLG